MTRLQIAVGVVLAVLGLTISWVGLNLSADFADLGSLAVSRGDDGSVPALVLIPGGLLVAAGGIVIAVLRRRFDPPR